MTQTVKTIIDAITSERMQRALRISDHSVIAARKAGSFPSSWYVVVEAMCAERGVECPKSLFNFKSPSVLPEGGRLAQEHNTADDENKEVTT